ncbi:MAG: hypothetical protein A2W85_00910 [Bacteroidetes bacterium GWF2_41_31]|nr:MAG: hypothetical protein A2W85_00910 [Bacteroidetes bacterium GWF2_41_31]
MILMGANYSRMTLLKEAIEIGEQIIEKATRYDMKLEIADGRSIMAVAYAQGGDYDNSSKLYFENLKLYEKLNEKRLLGITMGNIGADFLEQRSYEKALEYANKALSIGIATNDMTLVTDQYSNLAAIYYSGTHNLPEVLKYFFKSLEIAIKIDDFQLQGNNMLNIGHVYMEMNNLDSSYFFFNNALSIFQKLDNPISLADNYIALGNYFYLTNDFKTGKKLASLGFEIGGEYRKFQTIFEAANLLHKIYLSENDTIEAYKYYIIKTDSKDSLYLLRNQNELFKLEFQYNQEKRVKEQRMRQLRFNFILGFIILGLLSVLTIIVLFNSRQKIKIKNMILEKEKIESTLNFKSKELSINLLALLKKNELIAKISQKVSEFENAPSKIDLKEAAIRLNNEIKQSSDDRLWQEFSMRFKEINSVFYDKLLKKYPDLSQSEIKLCAYLRLNMSTKEISDLTGQSTETLGKARYRLRKKFGLTNSDSNLVTFLTHI